MADRALPDLKAKVVVDSSSLAAAEAHARAAGAGMALGLSKGGNAAQLVSKDIQGLERASAKAIPGLGGMGNSMMGLPGPALAAAAGMGILVGVGKELIDTYERLEQADMGLHQATDAMGVSFEEVKVKSKAWNDANRAFIPDQAEVSKGWATLTRSGLEQTRVQEDMNLALDLATIKHISLSEAALALTKVEQGKGKALVELGIVMKDYPILMEDAHAASVKLEAAEKAVEKEQLAYNAAVAAHSAPSAAMTAAQLALTAAIKAHGPHSAQATAAQDRLNAAIHAHGPPSAAMVAASAKLTAAQEKLAEAEKYTSERAAAEAEIHDALHKKLDGGRNATTEMEQAQNKLHQAFQNISTKAGPPLLHVLSLTFGAVSDLVDIISTLVTIVGQLIDKFAHLKVPDLHLPSLPQMPWDNSHGRAGGGAVLPNNVYTVGENGPETLMMGGPGGGGMVIPGGARGGGGDGGAGQTVVIHSHLYLDGKQVSEHVQKVIAGPGGQAAAAKGWEARNRGLAGAGA